MDDRRGVAFKKVAIPLLITTGDVKALPHLREREPLLGGLQSAAAWRWCICSEGIQTFAGYSFYGLVKPRTACVFAEPRYLQPGQIYWRLRRFLFEWPIFSSLLTAEVSAQRVQPSLLKRNPRTEQRQHSHTLDRLPAHSVSQGWFQTEMISALCVWRWSVISISPLSSPSTSLKEVHC